MPSMPRAAEIIPNRLSGYHDLNPPMVGAEAALAALAGNQAPEHYLASLHPTHPAYAMFRRALMLQGAGNEHAEDAPPIAPGPTIREGQRDDRVPMLRKRLARLGFMDIPGAANKDEVRPGRTACRRRRSASRRSVRSGSGCHPIGRAGRSRQSEPG